MRRELSVAALSAASLLPLAGCEAAHLNARPVDRGPITTNPPSVNLSGLPEILPPAVAALLPSVVRVEVSIKAGIYGEEIYESFGSGVRIRPETYLTAGHVIRDKDGNMIPGINTCGALVVDSATTKSTASSLDGAGDRIQFYGTSLYAQQEVSLYTKNTADSVNTPDAALVVAPDTQQVTSPFSPIELEKNKMVNGAQVYMANFEPTPEREQRTPDETKVISEELSKGLNKPAVMGAVVLANLDPQQQPYRRCLN